MENQSLFGFKIQDALNWEQAPKNQSLLRTLQFILILTVHWSICQEVGLPDINIQKVLKKDVKKAIQMSHHEDMLGQFENSRKLQDIKNDNFSTLQDYFHDKNLEKF